MTFLVIKITNFSNLNFFLVCWCVPFFLTFHRFKDRKREQRQSELTKNTPIDSFTTYNVKNFENDFDTSVKKKRKHHTSSFIINEPNQEI